MTASPGLALVSGASGFIGSHLAEQLLRRGYRVRCLVRPSSDLQYVRSSDVELVLGDLRWAESLAACVAGVDVVFHVAGVTAAAGKRGYFEGNTLGTANLVAACLENAQSLRRFVYVSSIAAAGPSFDGVPLTEDDPAHPISVYGRSKLAGERAVWRAAGRMPVTVIRPPIVFGPRDRDIYKFFPLVRFGLLPHVGHRERYLSLVYVSDLASGMIQAAESDRAIARCYYLANKEFHPRRAIVQHMARAMDVPQPRQIAVPEGIWYAVGLAMELALPLVRDPSIISREKVLEAVQDYWTCDPSRAQRELGWQAETPLEQALRQTARWYREHGWL